MRVCATIAPGLAPVVHREAQRVGLRSVPDELANAGWTALEADGAPDVVAALDRLRTVHRLGVVLASGTVDLGDPWDGLTELVATIDVEPWFGEGPFAVRGHRTGTHAYTSMDLAAHVGDALHDHLASELGTRPAVDLDDPEAIVRVHFDDAGHARLWLDLAGQAGLHRRGYRAYDHPAGMKASLAAGLLELADFQAEGAFADPMAGGGTLVTEALDRALGRSPTHRRREALLAWNAPVLREARKEHEARRRPADREDLPAFVLGDHAPNHVEGARQNLQRAGVDAHVESYVGPVSELPDHVAEAELVAANPPYGIRSGEGPLEEPYRELFTAAGESLASEGWLGLLTPKADLVHRLADEQGFGLREDLEVQHGRLTIRMMVLDAP